MARLRRFSDNPPAPHRQAGSGAVIAIFCLGLFMTLLDLTIVNIAIPQVVDHLHASLEEVLWVLNAYSLLYAVLLITSGRLGDIFGPRNVFAVGLVVFTAASAGSGFAHSPAQLIAFRALQGFGAALMSPQGIPLITAVVPEAKRGGAFAAIGAMSGLAVLSGPVLGGLLVTHVGWRWIFFINLPVGAVTLALTLAFMPDVRPGRRHRLDLPGVALATAGLFGVVFGLIEGEHYSWGTVAGFLTIPEIIAAGVLVLLTFLWRQARRQQSEPLLPFAVFKDRNFTLMALVLAAMGFAMVGLFLPLTIYYQSVLNLTALAAGLTLAPQAFAMMVSSSAAGALSQKIHGKLMLLPGLALFAAGTAYLVWAAQPDAGRWSLLPGLIVSGIGIGCVWIPVFSIATSTMRPELAGVSSGVLSTVQELGAVVATAAVGAVLQNRLAIGLHDRAVHDAARLPAAYRDQFIAGFDRAGRSGLQVGAGQTGGSVPHGLPAGITAQLRSLGQDVFGHGFVTAMRPTLLLPLGVIVIAAIGCLWVRAARPATELAEPVGEFVAG